jgi:sec-independent protein translocase protein TatA
MNLGMTEIMLIMVIALIVFGPRKLPELGKSLGQALAQFRRASDDFKRTWEQEVEIEQSKKIESSHTEPVTTTENLYNSDGSYNYGYDHDSGMTDTHHDHAATTEAHHTAEPVTEPAVAAPTNGTVNPAPTPGKEHWI